MLKTVMQSKYPTLKQYQFAATGILIGGFGAMPAYRISPLRLVAAFGYFAKKPFLFRPICDRPLNVGISSYQATRFANTAGEYNETRLYC